MTTTTISSTYRLNPQLNPFPDLTPKECQTHTMPVNENTNQAGELVKLQVIHATTGRVRIRTIDGSWNLQIQNLSQDLKQQIWVQEILVKKSRGSLTLNFDQNQVTLNQVLEFLAEFNVDYSSTTVRTYLSHLHQWKSLDFWKSQSSAVLPLIIGFALTKGLRVRGWLGIIIYMLSADTTRWLMSLATTTEVEKVELNLSEITTVNKHIHLAELPPKVTYKIVHQILGRVRFNVPKISQDIAYAQRLEKLLKADTNVTDVRINCQAASVAIVYSNPHITVNHWVQLMELALQTNPQNISIPTEQIPSPGILINPEESAGMTTVDLPNLNLCNLWADLKPPMISYSLDVLANFQF